MLNRSGYTVVFHPPFPVAAEKIKAKAVLGRLVFFQQFGFEEFPFIRRHVALKYGFLDPYSVIYTGFRDASESFRSRGVHGRDIVGYQNEH